VTGEAIDTPNLAANIQSTDIGSGEALDTPAVTVVPDAVDLTGYGDIASEEALGSPTISIAADEEDNLPDGNDGRQDRIHQQNMALIYAMLEIAAEEEFS
jgi:hypothetical protein